MCALLADRELTFESTMGEDRRPENRPARSFRSFGHLKRHRELVLHRAAVRSIAGMEGRFIDGFMSILDMKKSRLGSVQVLKLLEFPGIKEKFGIAESDVEIIEHWIRSTNIRWGRDAEHRHELVSD